MFLITLITSEPYGCVRIACQKKKNCPNCIPCISNIVYLLYTCYIRYNLNFFLNFSNLCLIDVLKQVQCDI